MAVRKARKAGKRPVRQARKSGSRSWTLVVLVAAAALAAVLYAVMSPSGIFKPGPVSSETPARKSVSGQKTASAQPAKPAPVNVQSAPVVAEVKPVVPAPAPVVPVAPVCTGQPLSLFDIQGKVGNPSWIFVDVRPVERFSAANIPGSRNLPAGDFDAAFAREGASLSQASGIVLYGEDSNDPSVNDVCIKMAAKNLPRIYLFREGWGRWPQTPAQ